MGKPPRIRRETKPVPSNNPVSKAKIAPSIQSGAKGLRILLQLTQRHPILFWSGAWLGMALISWLAIAGLTYTNPAPLETTEKPQPEAVKAPDSQVQPRTPATSFGLLAAVAISCTATSVLLARQLRPVKPVPRRFIKRTGSPTVKPNATVPPAPAPAPIPQVESRAIPAPTEASRATGWEAAKLADMLDIRQKPSVSSQG